MPPPQQSRPPDHSLRFAWAAFIPGVLGLIRPLPNTSVAVRDTFTVVCVLLMLIVLAAWGITTLIRARRTHHHRRRK